MNLNLLSSLYEAVRRSLPVACALAACASTHAEEPTPAPYSFLEPVETFARDTIWKPTDPFPVVPGQDPDGWGFVLEPYVWALGLSGDIGIRGLPPSPLSLSSRTILQNLEWGIFARGEVRKGRWGLLADGYYASLSGSGEFDNKIYQSVHLGVQQSLVSLALAYRIIDDRRGFLDLYAGARYNFLGLQADASLDQSRIGEIGSHAADFVASRVAARIDAAIASLPAGSLATAQNRLVGIVGSGLTDRVLEKDILRDRDLRPLVRQDIIESSLVRSHVRDALKTYLRAAVAARAAAASGTPDVRLQAAEASARKKLGKAIASRIEEATPTHGAGNEWWIDPIIGLRGQVNLTRWLFLAAQGDVGGFGVGSQIAWNVQATIGVNLTRNLFAEIGYRYVYIDYTHDGFVYDMNSFGLYSGLGVRF